MQIYHTTMEISHILYYNTMILLDNKRCKTIKTLKQKNNNVCCMFFVNLKLYVQRGKII